MKQKTILAPIRKLPKMKEGQSMPEAYSQACKNSEVVEFVKKLAGQAENGEIEEVACVVKTIEGVLVYAPCPREFMSHAATVLITHSNLVDYDDFYG
jgi:hypothetical protein